MSADPRRHTGDDGFIDLVKCRATAQDVDNRNSHLVRERREGRGRP
jgi:hypothetical protein